MKAPYTKSNSAFQDWPSVLPHSALGAWVEDLPGQLLLQVILSVGHCLWECYILPLYLGPRLGTSLETVDLEQYQEGIVGPS